jgi:hypothetical protein
MTYKYTNEGINFIESAISDPSVTEVVDTIAIGDGTTSPRESDTSLENNLYESNTTSANVLIDRGSGGTGEIRVTVEFTGGTEVPSGSDITEFGLKNESGTLLYREVRDTSITVASGEKKSVEMKIFIEDENDESDVTITTVGLDYVADRLIGNTNDVIDVIAVGEGTGTVSDTDTQMSNELYRSSNANSDVTIQPEATVGNIIVEISVSAGSTVDDNVPGDSNITEFGLFTDSNTMVLHEKRTAVTLEANDTKTFKIPFNIIQ